MQLDRRIVAGLLFCVLFSLALRTVPVASEVLAEQEVRFHSTDPWYHVRLIDSTVRNFPQHLTFDPWALAPAGHTAPVAPLFDLLVAGVALLVAFGKPSEHTVHVVAAVIPAVLGALIVLPVYGIGRRCWGRGVGLVAGGLIAVIPGVFLDRTRLGYADHHVTESLLAALTMLSLILALEAAERSGFTARSIVGADRKRLLPLLGRSALFGVCLGLYLLNWIGGFLLVGIVLTWVVVQVAMDHVRGRDASRVAAVVLPGLALVLMLLLTYPALSSRRIQLLSVAITIAVTVGMVAISSLTAGRKHRVLAFTVVSVSGAILFVATLRQASPDLLDAPLRLLRDFLTPGAGLEVAEVQPLLGQWNNAKIRSILLEFTTGGLLGSFGLILLFRAVVRRGDPRLTLMLVWSVLMIGATLVQVRFAYYSAVNIALLSALALRTIWVWAVPQDRASVRRPGNMTIAAALLLVAFVPNLLQARKIASFYSGPNADWREALHWMRESTPDPFRDPDDYYKRFESPPPGETFDYPESAYSVMNWWDYGYWILAMGRRVPTSIPTQAGAGRAAEFYLAQTEAEADLIMNRLRSRFVLVDATLPLLSPGRSGFTAGKFRSLAIWAGHAPEEYFERYDWEQPDGSMANGILYYPAYYRSMLVRLYLYEGRAMPPGRRVSVVSFVERTEQGVRRKFITDWHHFDSHAEARDWVEVQASPTGHRIVSKDPHSSCVPLEALEHYRLVYQSPSVIGQRADGTISQVEIFEYSRVR